MKKSAVIWGLLAAACLLAQCWLGPLYTMHDWCRCGQGRTWLQFPECPNGSVAPVHLFSRIERQGNPSHQHEFCDAVYEGQYPAFGYGFIILGAFSVVLWFSPLKRLMTLPESQKGPERTG